MTLCVGHRQGDVAIVDCVREARPPFSPEQVTQEFSSTLKSYGVSRVQGDKYAGEWPREQFRKHGVSYDLCTKSKSDLYVALLPILNSIRVELLDHPKVLNQLNLLERRTARGGKDSIDHPPGAGMHDDVANCVAGVCHMLIGAASGYDSSLKWVDGPSEGQSEEERNRQWRQQRFAAYVMSGGMVRL
jgi:hypothetical protein